MKVAELQGDVEKLLGVQQELAAEKASHETVQTEMNRLVLEVRVIVLPTSHLYPTCHKANTQSRRGCNRRQVRGLKASLERQNSQIEELNQDSIKKEAQVRMLQPWVLPGTVRCGRA